MRLVGIALNVILGGAVVAQTAYVMKTRGELGEVRGKLAELEEQYDDLERRAELGASRAAALASHAGVAGNEVAARPGRPGLPPPRFIVPPPGGAEATTSGSPGDPLPLPPGLDNETAREQLRQFVAAQLERQRDEGRVRRDEDREQMAARARETLKRELGLSDDQSRRLDEVLANQRAARDSLRARLESGQVARSDLGREFGPLRQQFEAELRGVLGEQGYEKLRQLQREKPEIRGAFGTGRPVFGGRRDGDDGAPREQRLVGTPPGAPPPAAPTP